MYPAPPSFRSCRHPSWRSLSGTTPASERESTRDWASFSAPLTYSVSAIEIPSYLSYSALLSCASRTASRRSRRSSHRPSVVPPPKLLPRPPTTTKRKKSGRPWSANSSGTRVASRTSTECNNPCSSLRTCRCARRARTGSNSCWAKRQSSRTSGKWRVSVKLITHVFHQTTTSFPPTRGNRVRSL